MSMCEVVREQNLTCKVQIAGNDMEVFTLVLKVDWFC